MGTEAKVGLDSLGSLLLSESLKKGNKTMEGRAYFYLSAFQPNLSNDVRKSRLSNLSRAQKIAEELNNDTLLCYVYNQRGVWAMMSEGHTVTAQYWFSRALDHAARTGSSRLGIPAAMNMSEACRTSGDTMGIIYDRELLEFANREKDPLLRFVSGLHCASYYAPIAKDTTELHPYIEAMRGMEKEYPGAIEYIYATYYYHKEDLATAERYIIQANPDTDPDYQSLYAQILYGKGDFLRSIELTDHALKNHKLTNLITLLHLTRLKAANLQSIGRSNEAYSMLCKYEQIRDSMDHIRSTDLSRRYKTEYEVYAKDREISEHKTRIRTLVISISTIILAILAAGVGLTLWYRRRNVYYRNIVRQNLDFAEHQDLANERIARRDAHIAELETRLADMKKHGVNLLSNDPEKRTGRISDEKANEIFERIQRLTEQKQIWRDVTITRDSLAEMVGCNRTYLTDVIKSQTGMGYSQYMNSCRIHEAVRMLSNPSDETPLKDMAVCLGFLSLKTFYSAFRQNTGMSPATFRETARKMQ